MRGALLLEARDDVLVEIVAGDDARPREAGLVEQLARLDAESTRGRPSRAGCRAARGRAARSSRPDLDRRAARPRACRRCRRGRCSCWASPRRRPRRPRARRRTTSPSCARACRAPGCRTAGRRARSRSPRSRRRRRRGWRRAPPSMPCARRSPNSSTGSPLAARQTRAALVAISVWKLMMLSSARLERAAPGGCGPRTRSERLVREDDRALGHRVDVARRSAARAGRRGSRARTAACRRCPLSARQVREVVVVEAEALEVARAPCARPQATVKPPPKGLLAEDEVEDRLALGRRPTSSSR